jgi:hypothetical protein
MSECVCTHTIYSMSLLLNLVDSASIVYIRPYRYIAHYKMGKNWIYRSLFTIRSDQMSKFTFMYTHYPVASVGCPQSIKTQHTKLVDSFWQWSILQKNSTTWYPGVSLMSDVNKNGSWMIHDGCNHENCHAMMQGNPCMMQHQGGHFHVSCLLNI